MKESRIDITLSVQDDFTWPLVLAYRKTLRFSLKLKGLLK